MSNIKHKRIAETKDLTFSSQMCFPKCSSMIVVPFLESFSGVP